MSDTASVMYATPCPTCQRTAVRLVEGTRQARCAWCGTTFAVELRVKLDGPEFTAVQDDPYGGL